MASRAARALRGVASALLPATTRRSLVAEARPLLVSATGVSAAPQPSLLSKIFGASASPVSPPMTDPLPGGWSARGARGICEVLP